MRARLILLYCWVWFQPSALADSHLPELLPADQVFKVSAQAVSSDRIEFHWDVAQGYSLYKNNMRFTAKTTGVQLAEPDFPAGQLKHDEFLGEVVHFRNGLTVPITLTQTDGAKSVDIQVQYQGCADWGVCYPPQKKILTVDLASARPMKLASTDSLSQLVKGFSGILPKAQDELLPPDQAFQFFAEVKTPESIHVNWLIADGYYLYREKTRLEIVDPDAVQLAAFSVPHGTPKHDEEFGEVEIFHNDLSFDVPLVRRETAATSIQLKAYFQGCADRGVCYPPMEKTIELALPTVDTISSGTNQPSIEPVSEQDKIVSSLQHDSFGMTLLSFFGFGLLLSFTPCIFPMVPILSGIIVGHRVISTMRAFMLSFSYVFASALTYTVFGILAALFGSNLQTTFQQPWIIGLFSGIFVVLSLSMFGFYHLELPKSWQLRLHNSGEKHRDGSMLGAAIMGSLSSLIVGPCVAAPLAAALIYIGRTGDWVLGAGTLFAMGMGMGVPLLLLGASAGKLLPKAGEWLNATKSVFGVVMLAVAIWMLGRILPPSVTMLLWAAWLIIPAIYLSALDPLPPNASGWRKLWKGTGMLMLAYGLLLLIGFSSGNTNPLQPLQGLALGKAQAAQSNEGLRFERVANLAEMDARIRQANADHQLVMLDFYADWCISCKEMEAYTFTDPKVKAALANVVLLQADVTENSDNDKALLARFNLIGPPAILFFGLDGQEKTGLRVIGFQDAEAFLQTLRRIQ